MYTRQVENLKRRLGQKWVSRWTGDLIDAKEVEFDAPEKPNVISAPMPKHDHNVHAVLEDLHVIDVANLLTPLLVIKENLMRAGIFPGCGKDCYFCLNI